MNGFAPPKSQADPEVAETTRACILTIGLERLERIAGWDGYVHAVLDDYRRLKAEELVRRSDDARRFRLEESRDEQNKH